MNFLKSHAKTNALIGFVVFIVSLLVYLRTVAPSICLWDCGEYLASTACLGLPHPPGTPLLVMFGRVWVMLFSFLHNVGYQYNLMAVFSSSVTVVFVYLIIVRSLILVLGDPDTVWKRLVLYCCGLVGALFCAFNATFWFAALEACQQSNITNITVIITIWLALVWAQSKRADRDRYLLLIGYVAFAGVGLRMISMLTMPAISLFVMIVDPAKRKDWRFWVVSFMPILVMYNLSWFLVVVPSLAVITLAVLAMTRKERPEWRFCFWFLLLALIGFSSHLYLPIRSSLDPGIDEGHPVIKATSEFPYFDMKPLKEVLDRKQYGNESMVSRSFWRRGTVAHQFGIDGHMGYGGFHMLQFYHFDTKDQEKNFVDGTPAGFGKLLIYLLPTIFVLLGWYLMTKKNKKAAALLVTITLLTTLGMVWYMNFSDGSKCDSRAEYDRWDNQERQHGVPMPTIYREVRTRDYFYSTGFMFFSMWMGLSAGLVLYRLFSDKNGNVRTFAAPCALVLFFVSPALPLSQNYALRDRSQNWLPFEYAYNLLNSCEKDGVLFTNGDNDTFPLWAIQQAYGVRKDVRLVNLSLVNTEWYIKELKRVEPRVAVSYSEDEIDALEPRLNPFDSTSRYTLDHAGIPVMIPGREKQQVMRVQDMMVLNIVDANAWAKPIYFACSVSPDNFMGLDPYLQMQGMVYRLLRNPIRENERMDIERTGMLIDKVYKLRKIPQHHIDKDEPYDGIGSDYGMCFMWYSMQLQERMAALEPEIKDVERRLEDPSPKVRKTVTPADSIAMVEKRRQSTADFDKAVNAMDRCVDLMTWNMQPIQIRQQILLKYSKGKMAEDRIRALLKTNPDNSQLRDLLVQALEAQGKRKEAQEFLQGGVPMLPGSKG
jgi:hypothetical protein